MAALHGCERILHAGDIGNAGVLEALGKIAPIQAVRGNNDRGPWARGIAESLRFELGGATLYMLHDLKAIAIDPAAEKIRVVVSGHSHRPAIEERDGVLYVNPGSAGPRRFKLPVTVAELRIDRSSVTARIVSLE